MKGNSHSLTAKTETPPDTRHVFYIQTLSGLAKLNSKLLTHTKDTQRHIQNIDPLLNKHPVKE